MKLSKTTTVIVREDVIVDLVAMNYSDWPQEVKDAAYIVAAKHMDKLRALATPRERRAYLEPLIEKYMNRPVFKIDDLFN